MPKVFNHSLTVYLAPLVFSFVAITSPTLFLLLWVLNNSYSLSYDNGGPDIETPAYLGLKKRW